MYDDNVAGSAENSSNHSARALDSGEPVEEPQTDGTGDVENHLSNLDLDLTIGSSCRGHHVSFSW